MTTITIKNGEKIFTKTSFATAEKLLDYLLQQLYFDKNLPALSNKELAKAEQARKEWQQNPENFKKVIK